MSYLRTLFTLQFILLAYAKAQVEQLQGSQAYRHENCPQIDDPKHPVLLPYEYDCSKYYSCLAGFAYLQSCPNKLHWSSITYRCEFPERVSCRPRTKPKVPISAEQVQLQPVDVQKKFSDDHSNHLNGYQYVKPIEDARPTSAMQTQLLPLEPLQYTFLDDSSKYLFWNQDLNRCVLPEYLKCAVIEKSLIPTPNIAINPVQAIFTRPTAATPPPTYETWMPLDSTNTIPNQDELNELCKRSDTKFISFPGDRHRFIQCNGIAFIQQCPGILCWNSKVLACDYICEH